MVTLIHRFIRCESGATAVEYALIAAGIAVATLTAINALGTAVATLMLSEANSPR